MKKFLDVLFLISFSLTCLFPLIEISTARPTIEPTSGFFSTPRTTQLQAVRSPRGHVRNTRMLSPRVEAHVHRKRTPPGSTSPSVFRLKLITYQTLGLITPIAGAARALEEFYSSIAVKAAGVWQGEPRQYEFAILQGDFRLSFKSLGDAIPWSFVQEMAERGWECASRGLTDVFEVIYMDEAAQIAVSVSLGLVDGSSTGSGSGSGSGSDYREGSVPSVTSP